MSQDLLLPEYVKMCNCARCGCELLGQSMRWWVEGIREKDQKKLPPMVYCRIEDRPYCRVCGSIEECRKPKGTADPCWRHEPSASMEDAVRHLEDG